MQLTLGVLYSCHVCGLEAIEVQVPARADEDVVVWVKDTAARCGRDHQARSPHCPSDNIDLKIPLPAGTDRVGGPPAH